jgi:hypothetical protein
MKAGDATRCRDRSIGDVASHRRRLPDLQKDQLIRAFLAWRGGDASLAPTTEQKRRYCHNGPTMLRKTSGKSN